MKPIVSMSLVFVCAAMASTAEQAFASKPTFECRSLSVSTRVAKLTFNEEGDSIIWNEPWSSANSGGVLNETNRSTLSFILTNFPSSEDGEQYELLVNPKLSRAKKGKIRMIYGKKTKDNFSCVRKASS